MASYTDYILKQNVGSPGAAKVSGTSAESPRASAASVAPANRAAIAAFLMNPKKKGAVLELAAAMQSTANITATTTASSPSAPSDLVSKTATRANKIASRNQPYLWGGGHAGNKNTLRGYKGPLDCSGAVSKALGIDPRVSGEFTRWGKAGDGGGRGITVYANDKHVLMKINGRFFGTSGSNPGGGANWIPANKINKAYLSKFTARHL
jgi:hypothetical protein